MIKDWNLSRLTSVGGKLYLAFGAVGLLTVFITVLGLYSFDRFGTIVQSTTTQTMPLVVGAERLAERSSLLSASAPNIALAQDEPALQATMLELDALLREIHEAMAELADRTSPEVLVDVRRDIEELATILKDLKELAEQRFVVRQRQDAFLSRINKVSADFSDTVHPVTYGIHSLMGLLANRAGRRMIKEINHLGERDQRALTIMVSVRQIMEALKPPADRKAPGGADLPLLRRAIATSILDGLEAMAGDLADPDLPVLVEIATRIQDAKSLDDSDLGLLSQQLQNMLDRQTARLVESHHRVAQGTRDTIIRSVDMAVREGGTSAEIRALGSHVISLLNTAAVLDSTDAVFDLRAAFDRSFEALRDALREFEKSALAQNNPILAGNLRGLEQDLNDLGHGELNPFVRQAAVLALNGKISDRLAEGREISNRMARKVKLLVTNIMAGVEMLGRDTSRQHLVNSAILTAGGLFSLLAIVIIAVFTASNSRRHEVDLRRAKDEAEGASRAKSEFLSSMSHELRTPLHAVLGFAQLLATDREHSLDATQKDGVDHILKSGGHLLELINHVLDLARIESGSLSISIDTVAPRDVIAQCLVMARTMADKRAITVEDKTAGRELSPIRADRTRFQQILLNLLSNAVKYNRDGGCITLDCPAGKPDMLRFAITDTGPGIAEDKQAKLFLPFHRLGMEGKQIEGAGIGLTITRELVLLMGGQVGFESRTGVGSTFWIDLPLASEAQRAALAAAPPAPLQPESDEPEPARLGQQLVLYVEDNPDLLQLMGSIIQRLPNLKMISAHNAELGLVLAEKEQPNLILMDINLPGMDGIEARRQLQANGKTAHIPVVAVSGAAMPHDLDKAREEGFLAYLTKPFEITTAIRILKAALEQRGEKLSVWQA